jgi:hypothetical protein
MGEPVQSISSSSSVGGSGSSVDKVSAATSASAEKYNGMAEEKLKSVGIDADTKVPDGGFKDAKGQSYTFDEAKTKVAGMFDALDNPMPVGKSNALKADIDKFVNELAASMKPAAESAPEQSGAQNNEAQKAEAPSGGGNSSAPAASSALPPTAQQALNRVMPENLLSMLDSSDESELQELIQKMLAAGATPEQIKAALKAKAAEAINAKGGSAADVAAAGAKIDAAVDKASGAESKSSSLESSSTMKVYA